MEKRSISRESRQRGFSLIEAIVVVGALSVMATFAVVLMSSTRQSTATHKLVSDVRNINTAIQVYQVSGGNLDGVSGPADIVARLRSHATDESAVRVAGLTGSKVDARLSVEMQTAAESATTMPRAIWNPSEKRFEISEGGPRGVKLFYLDDAAAAVDQEITYRPTMQLAKEDTWIWDYTDVLPGVGVFPTVIPTVVGGGGPGPGAGPGPGPGPGPGSGPGPTGSSGRLNKPIFSVPGGKYPIAMYDLTLFLLDTNPPLTSRILYSVDDSPWQIYAGTPISVEPDTTILAKAEAIVPEYYDSRPVEKTYKAKPAKLDPPLIVAAADRFDLLGQPTVGVMIANTNDPTVSMLLYKVNDEDWVEYTGEFEISAVDYEKGAKIRSRAIPTAEYYSKSSITEELVKRAVPLFSGSSIAYFSDPVGGQGIITNLGGGATDTFFRWGSPYRAGDPPSWMRVSEQSFTEVRPDERFSLASLEYYNGTIHGGSGAKGVSLNVELNIDSGHIYTFDFDLELINTPNNNGTPEEAADFVHLATLASNSATTINGDDYYLVLEFGETSANGFSTVDEFHVLENASATGALYATLILAGDLDAEDPYYFGDKDEEIETEGTGVEDTLAPLLLALDATTIKYDIPSIEDAAAEHGVTPEWLINEEFNPEDPGFGFDGHTGNPWLNWSEYHAGDEVLLPGGTLSNHGWWTLGNQTDTWANDFAEGAIPEIDLRNIKGPDFMDSDDLSMLYNRTVVAVVYDGGLSKRRAGPHWMTNLDDDRLGRIAFTVIGVEAPASGDPEALWDIRVRIEPPILTPTVYDLDPWADPDLDPGHRGSGLDGPIVRARHNPNGSGTTTGPRTEV